MSTGAVQTHLDARGVLEVTLDAPKSRVNIVTADVSEQLYEVFTGIDRGDCRLVVVRSGKPRSFVNGAQLMLASAVQDPERIFDLTAGLRSTYRAFEDVPVPTVAAVRGACYGCGVEFILRADWRVAADGADTTFYMTEVVDYLDAPAFGSTQLLPGLMGLESAIEFLIWGHRLWGRRAEARGLVQDVLPSDRFEAELDAWADKILSEGLPNLPDRLEGRDEIDEIRKRAFRDIDKLPEAYRSVHRSCVELMCDAARNGGPTEKGYDDELREAGRTLVDEQARAARSFLYIRQLAERRAVRDMPTQRQIQFTADQSDHAYALLDELIAQHLPGMVVSENPDGGNGEGCHFHLCSWKTPSKSGFESAETLAVCMGTMGVHPPDGITTIRKCRSWLRLTESDVRVPSTGTRPLIEIAHPEQADWLARLYELLDAAGFAVAVTRPDDLFATDAFYLSFLAPIVAFVHQTGRPADVDATLREFGWVPTPLEHLRRVDETAHLAGPLSDLTAGTTRSAAAVALQRLAHPSSTDGESASELRVAILLNLLARARRCLAQDVVDHPATVDVICRELLGFPLGQTSLCEHLTVERVDDLLGSSIAFDAYVRSDTLQSAESYVAEGVDFYA